jgi:MFS family permease
MHGSPTFSSSPGELTVETFGLPLQQGTWADNLLPTFSSVACQPLFGQIADIFGRRWLAISIFAFYVFGSGICGGVDSAGVLIGGRAIQGIGCKASSRPQTVYLLALIDLFCSRRTEHDRRCYHFRSCSTQRAW